MTTTTSAWFQCDAVRAPLDSSGIPRGGRWRLAGCLLGRGGPDGKLGWKRGCRPARKWIGFPYKPSLKNRLIQIWIPIQIWIHSNKIQMKIQLLTLANYKSQNYRWCQIKPRNRGRKQEDILNCFTSTQIQFKFLKFHILQSHQFLGCYSPRAPQVAPPKLSHPLLCLHY
jgi:hypothetical protein